MLWYGLGEVSLSARFDQQTHTHTQPDVAREITNDFFLLSFFFWGVSGCIGP